MFTHTDIDMLTSPVLRTPAWLVPDWPVLDANLSDESRKALAHLCERYKLQT